MSINFEDLTFLVLTADHLPILDTFKCKNSELKGFLIENAYRDQIERVSVTRLVFYDGILVGYFTLVTDVIKKIEIADGDGDPGFSHTTYPALKIARLATHNDYERQGIGRHMLMKIFAIWIQFSEYIGCRIITVDAKPEATEFYKKFDFHEAIVNPKKLIERDTVPLYIDIRKELDGLRRDRTLTEFED
jgi:GNAT superfamily N-acetyltransferase